MSKPTNFAISTLPAANVATTATGAVTVDRTGFNYATFIVLPGKPATDGETIYHNMNSSNMSSIKIDESASVLLL